MIRDSQDKNIWHGKVDGVELTFTVIGTYGDNRDPIILTIPKGVKIAINWNTGKSLKRFDN